MSSVRLQGTWLIRKKYMLFLNNWQQILEVEIKEKTPLKTASKILNTWDKSEKKKDVQDL